MRITDRIDKKWISQIDGKPTFRGIIDDYLDEEKVHWRLDSTIKSYGADFDSKILPKLLDHNRKTIDQYTKEDFDQVVQIIKEEGKSASGKVFQPYADSTIQHFRHIIYEVVKAAVEAKLCEDILWGTEYALTEKKHEDYSEEIEELVRLKKSFTPEEEKKIAAAVFTNPRQRGQEMGILLMDAFGLRNNEACGTDFGCIKPMDGHAGSYELWVYQSTKRGTNILGSSGKTKNADRIIPIPDLVYQFLMERKEFVESELRRIAEEQGIKRDELPDIDELPIACCGTNYMERCASRHLTAACRELFKEIGVSEKMLAYLDRDLHQNDYSELKEKEATAYTFRRNFGTHLFILGLDEAEIQYIIGHDVEDPYETRNEYVNEDRRYAIKLKMEQRPIFNTIHPVNRITFSPCANSIEASAHGHLQVEIPAEPGIYQIHIQSKEPGEEMDVTLIATDGVKEIAAAHLTSGVGAKNERTVDIVEDYQKRYV
ncbi:MAG: hypothetical protein ACI4TK_19355 [Agathobacter sp.]